MKKRILAIILTVVMLVGMIPLSAIPAAAADGVKYLEYNTETGAFDERTCTDYTPLADGVTTWTGGWYVAPAGKLELGEVNVNGSACLILPDGCELIIGGGLHVNEGNSITIYAQSEGENMGSLTTTKGSFCAGIGSTYKNNGGDITIHGGKITAIGGAGSAGIGGGNNGNSNNITIYNGIITANADDNAAGIGGGNNGNSNNITIYNGVITANGGDNAAGIGGGFYGNSDNITIYNGVITANGGDNAAGIGGGFLGSSNNITIDKGTIRANGKYEGIQGTITLLDSQVIIQDRLSGSLVIVDSTETWRKVFNNKSVYIDIIDLNCKLKDCTTITSDIIAWNTGWYLATGNVTITKDVEVTGDVHLILMSGCNLTVNGSIKVENENSLSIYSLSNGEKPGSLTANGNDYTAGIGSGKETGSGIITICGGNITANGGKYGAGIGGGLLSAGGSIAIYGGKITANGGPGGAGIGGYGNSRLTVIGGYVNATGGWDAAGIGGNKGSHGINITVTGGSIIAKSSGGGNAIGHGDQDTDNGVFYSSSGVTLYRPDGSVVPYMTGDINHPYIGGSATVFGNTNEVAFYARSSVDNYPYIEYNTTKKEFEKKGIYNPGAIFENNPTWSAPWNIVENDITFNQTITVQGDVNLILKDGCMLMTNGGITVPKGSSLTVYAQSKGAGMGKIDSLYEGITVEEGAELFIHGGNITAKGGNSINAGIGSGSDQTCGSITIYGGKIYAEGGPDGGAGIGNGWYDISYDYDEMDYICDIYKGTTGKITIYGGEITAVGGFGAAGIGGGYGCDGGNITIYGGNINATGGEGFYDNSYRADGIGCGWFDVLDDDYNVVYSLPVGDGSLHIYGDDVYSNGEKIVIPYTTSLEFNTMSLTLDGAIGVNFYVQINDEDYVGENAYMTMEFDNFGEKMTKVVALKDAEYDSAKGKYKFTFYVNSLQMAEDINATFYYGENESIARSTSVKNYAEALIGKSTNTKSVELAKAILTYGYYAQLALQETHKFTLGTDGKYDAMPIPENTPDTSIDLSEYALTLGGSNDNITALSMSLALDNRTDIYLYVTTDAEPTVTGADVEIEKVGERYRITIPNIAAHELATTYNLDIDGLTVDVSAFSYINTVLKSTTRSTNYKLAAAALYEYYTAALAYAAK